ncbi:MAG: LytTR family DNA-binding domain-containing protein [Tannerellaceae bacterium]|nr:LytTR family DNA-binding domain-containing protein [Tannerellaceae bacterium]
MNCIIVDDEPLARKTIELLINKDNRLELAGDFSNAVSAMQFLNGNPVDLIFLDIQMPKVTGLEFARMVPPDTLIIFTTAYSEYALDSYDIDAIDYLIKPIQFARFQKAVSKAVSYYHMLKNEEKEAIESIQEDHMFVKADRKYFKVEFNDILFIEGLKDYLILQCTNQKIITRMTLKNMLEELPSGQFLRVNKSYIVNTKHITSFDNNDIFIRTHEIAIGNSYRDSFF